MMRHTIQEANVFAYAESVSLHHLKGNAFRWFVVENGALGAPRSKPKVCLHIRQLPDSADDGANDWAAAGCTEAVQAVAVRGPVL